MSQAKVDKKKYEKKNRAAIMRRHKRNKVIGWCVVGIIVGCVLAATLGVRIYKAIPKYVEAEKLDAYVSEVWAEGGYGSEYFPNSSSSTASDTDASASEDTDSTDASETDSDASTDASTSEEDSSTDSTTE